MISVKHLTKYYGEHLAVDDVSFEISEGHVYGFLGPNGAGKSTTMNIITGCLSATDGKVLIDGHDIFDEPNAAKKLIGYLPEHPPLYMNESPLEYLRFVGEAKGLRGAELSAQVNEVIEKTGIANVKNRRISALSKGYKQRVGIAQALLGNPKVIILDEPTVGLDPIQIIEIRELITELGKTHTVIFSSHILSEVQAICDQILMIAKGKLVAFGDPEELQRTLVAPNEIILTTDATEDELSAITAKVEHIGGISSETDGAAFTVAHIKSEHDDIYALSSAIFRAFAGSDKVIYEMALKKGNLEDVFLELSNSAETVSETAPDDSAESEVNEE
ncbi:MAG: ABC transporter ATP-binding protein [Lachnospiraceae bacterium]|nr:ABC transporter ATP-binding protein [Lachnospiraceae bacterium]